MKNTRQIIIMTILAAWALNIHSQETGPGEEQRVSISGEFLMDERFILAGNNDWAWNENRITLKLDRPFSNRTRFFSEIWVRNFGLPEIYSSNDLFNKGNMDPVQLEIREANIQVNDFLVKNLDLKIGRQREVWGTADQINLVDNLNPHDMEDILDFGRRRGSDAINATYYVNSNLFVQGIYIPIFRPANMPVGLFADALQPEIILPGGMNLKEFSDTLLMPGKNLRESSTIGLRFKALTRLLDFSMNYTRGYDGLPIITRNTFLPLGPTGETGIHSELSFSRSHILGIDFATSIAGAGLWGEAALFVPDQEVIMTNDMSQFYPSSSVPMVMDSTILDKPYLKFILGGDYIFRDGSYLNVQYLHGFFHERGRKNLNDYFFARYEKKFFNERLTIAPLSGAFIVSDWGNIRDNSTVVYIPQISFLAAGDLELSVSLAVFSGSGEDMFARFNDYDMVMFRLGYFF